MSAITLAPGANFKVDAVTKQFDPQLSLKETGYGSRRKAVFKFVDCILPLHDNAGVGGEIVNQIGLMPSQGVVFSSGSVDLTVERFTGTTTSLADAWTGMVGVGSTIGVAADLTTTEQNIVAKTVPAAAAAGKALVNALSGAGLVVDASAGTSHVFLNILVDDGSQDGSVTPATVKLNGTVTLHYEVLGKDAA